ncbi:STAGA complex 65 subunit gamma-like [Neocloeon triangulifer]|uniref:STAGA complex 65 subunit gamma-like n=1 Tax=Neocloeon triangulifer TaxID=2078957 RepID=UPI00286F60ED|nr:STAGA complex 65 subunit gamma-like [Neocloeon triangulifer]
MSESRKLWGEIPKPSKSQEPTMENQPLPKRENLLVDVPLKCTPLPGPQPKQENDDWAKLDENVLTAIQCLDVVRQMGRESELSEILVQLQREDEKIIPWKRRRRHSNEDVKPNIHPSEGIDSEICRKVTKKAVTALVAHSGCHYAKDSVLETLTDAAKHFIFSMGLQLSHRKANQSPESALMETGIGTMADLLNYYEERVIVYRLNLEAAIQKLQENPLPLPVPQEEETAVEIHFPAGSEEMQSSLETGLQMLLSMEEGLE